MGKVVIENQEHEIHELISISVEPDIDRHASLLSTLLKKKDIPGIDLVHEESNRYVVKFNSRYFKYVKPTFFIDGDVPKIMLKEIDPELFHNLRELYNLTYGLSGRLVSAPIGTEITDEADTFINILKSIGYVPLHEYGDEDIVTFNSTYLVHTDDKIDLKEKYKNIVKEIKWGKL